MRKQGKIYNATFLDDEYDEGNQSDQRSSIVTFTTHVKEISSTELPSANVFPNDNKNITDEYKLFDDTFVKSYKILYLN